MTATLGGWLVHVMRKADGALSLEEALHVIMDSMKECCPCQSVAVMLIDQETLDLRIKISRNISYTFAKQFSRRGASATAEQVVMEQRPILLNNVREQAQVYDEIKLEHDFVSAVLAPVVKNRRGVGYIFVDRDEPHPFTDSDMLHLQVVGYLIGSLMEKFELIKSSKQLSSIDDATQALQYKAFVPAMGTEMERAITHAYPLTVSLLIVDAFRKYIDTYGIDEAHGLLAAVVATVKKHIRDMDLLARFGADEFILCLSGMTNGESVQKLEAIRRDIQDHIVNKQDASPIHVTMAAVQLDGERDLKTPIQDLFAAVGKIIMQTKTQRREDLVVVPIKEILTGR